LPIPAKTAITFGLFNSNFHNTGLGFNEFIFSTYDGFITEGILKSSGCSKKGDIYAKNLHGSGNLKLLGNWFYSIGAIPGDRIQIDFLSPKSILLSKI
ncbi:MAG: hypothetical protein ACRC6B_06530, partial [Fusobacteriaceae bacterium]